MELAHTVWRAEDSDPQQQAWFVHGIMGSQRNWRSFGKAMAESYPDWSCVTIDLRNHGATGHAEPPNTMEACADDLEALAERIGAPRLLSGHSFGGKVALEYASRHPEALDDLLVLDCPPGQGRTAVSDSGEGELARVLAALTKIPQPLPRRGEVIQRLVAEGLSRALASWMSTNLKRVDEGEGYVWTFDLDAIREMIADYWAHDYFEYLEAPDRGDGPRITFVRAERSDRWDADDLKRLEALAGSPAANILLEVLPKAGHWLHVDEPEALAALLRPHFA